MAGSRSATPRQWLLELFILVDLERFCPVHLLSPGAVEEMMAVAECCLGLEVAQVVRTIGHLSQIFGGCGVAGVVGCVNV